MLFLSMPKKSLFLEGYIQGIVTDYDDDNRARLEALAPDYVYCNQDKIGQDEALWPGPWHWVLYEITRHDEALRWRRAGAAMIETMHPPRFIGASRLREPD